ncbi:alpha/beta hydrolase [Halorubellus litoreus]|uniref:Alpha/beta fold hydrolase n=1 Tax=Halorubellus litoreus TaxID=755308 RepID=A0ABD5VH60_9EURY
MSSVEINGVSTYYEEYGDGPPLVVLHGATSDHQLWAEQLQPLTDSLRVIVYDLRGHGQSEGSTHKRYTIERYADDLAAFIDTLGLERPTVCGLSTGGMIGYQFAANYPEQLSALATVGAPTPQTFTLGERLTRVDVAKLLTPIMGNDRLMRTIDWVWEQLFRDSTTVDMDDLEEIRDSHACDAPEMQASEREKVMRGVQSYIGSQLEWDRIDVPVLAMYGENEPFIDRHTEYLDSVLEECRVREIPDATHNSHVDNPEFIIEELQEFHSGFDNH